MRRKKGNIKLPYIGHIITGDVFIGSMRVQKITAHLHIIPEIFQGRVKVRRHTELPFGTAKYGNFLLARLRPLFGGRGKRENDRPRRNFVGYVNDEPVVSRYQYSLFNSHVESIA